MKSRSESGTALVGVFREQRPRLWGFLVRNLEDRAIAEDLMQEAFLRVWDHRTELASASEDDEREAARRYLWRVTRNLAIDEIRSRVRRRAHEESQPPPPLPSRPDREVEYADCLRTVREAAAHLSNRRVRECIELWMAGESLADIAEKSGLGLGQVRGLLQRGKAEIVLRATNRLRAG
jgi:RNA polymerase sigma-70 factor (ECF subfamily)